VSTKNIWDGLKHTVVFSWTSGNPSVFALSVDGETTVTVNGPGNQSMNFASGGYYKLVQLLTIRLENTVIYTFNKTILLALSLIFLTCDMCYATLNVNLADSPYNVVGNNTDESIAIQAAYTAVGAAGGGVITWPTPVSRFHMTRPLVIYSNTDTEFVTPTAVVHFGNWTNKDCVVTNAHWGDEGSDVNITINGGIWDADGAGQLKWVTTTWKGTTGASILAVA